MRRGTKKGEDQEYQDQEKDQQKQDEKHQVEDQEIVQEEDLRRSIIFSKYTKVVLVIRLDGIHTKLDAMSYSYVNSKSIVK